MRYLGQIQLFSSRDLELPDYFWVSEPIGSGTRGSMALIAADAVSLSS
jgi:hypothetical protein